MKKLVLLFFIAPVMVFAQKIGSVNSHQNGNKIDITYKLMNIMDTESVKVSVFYAVNGAAYVGPLKNVTGDVGNFVSGVGVKKITWDVIAEIGSLDGDVKFKVEIEPSKIVYPTAKDNNLEMSIEQVVLEGTTLKINFVAESTIDNSWAFNPSMAFYFDNLGQKFNGSKLKVGDEEVKHKDIYLIKNVPFKLQYIFNDVDPNLNIIKAFEYKTYQVKLQYRDIQIKKMY